MSLPPNPPFPAMRYDAGAKEAARQGLDRLIDYVDSMMAGPEAQAMVLPVCVELTRAVYATLMWQQATHSQFRQFEHIEKKKPGSGLKERCAQLLGFGVAPTMLRDAIVTMLQAHDPQHTPSGSSGAAKLTRCLISSKQDAELWLRAKRHGKTVMAHSLMDMLVSSQQQLAAKDADIAALKRKVAELEDKCMPAKKRQCARQ